MTQECNLEPMSEMFILTMNNLLDQLEQVAAKVQGISGEASDIDSIAKIMQAIRGSSGMMKYTNMSSLAHAAEDLFFFIRESQPSVVDFPNVAELVFHVTSFIKQEIHKLEKRQAADGKPDDLIMEIEKCLAELKAADEYGNTPNGLHAYQAEIYFEEDCEMENMRAFSVLHNIEQIAQEITHTPADIDCSESSKIIQKTGFHLCFKTAETAQTLHGLFAKIPFLKEFQLCEQTKSIVLENSSKAQNSENQAVHDDKRQNEKIQSAVSGDKGVERMPESRDSQHEDTQKGKFLTFSVGNEFYGIEIKYVKEIIGGIQAITEVPELPEYVKGIINLRGTIIPVMDIRLRFKKQPKAYNDRTCIVVVNIREFLIGLIVDAVSEVSTIAEQDIVAPPNGHRSFQNRYIRGIGKAGSEVKLLLDCNKLISDEEYEQLTELQ